MEDRPVELAGVVAKVDAARHAITVSADDVRATEKDIELLCDESVDLSGLEKDELVAASVKIAPDGTYHVTGFSEDTDADAADDKSAARGDQAEQP